MEESMRTRKAKGNGEKTYAIRFEGLPVRRVHPKQEHLRLLKGRTGRFSTSEVSLLAA
jgi:hypothetical protein